MQEKKESKKETIISQNEILINKEDYTRIIAKQLLKDMGVKIHILGFKYWVTALIIIQEKERNQEEYPIMMELYELVARKHKATVSKVERAMRYAYADINVKKYFKVKYPINNTALLFLLTEELENRLNNNLN